MKLIPLSQQGKNKGKYFAQVDNEDYDFITQWKWSFHAGYAVRSEYRDKKTVIYMHRAIMRHGGLLDESKQVDHIDSNRLNNQKSNLRNCSISENMKNRTAWARSTSKYLGVSLYIKGNTIRWRADISVNHKQNYLGKFKTEAEAALAYNEAALRYHGEFARLNVIEQTLS